MTITNKGTDDKEILIGNVLPEQMADSKYSIIVRMFFAGQFRIILCNSSIYDPDAPKGHGAIELNLCTYKFSTMMRVVDEIKKSSDALKQAWSYSKDGDKTRIRLDQQEEVTSEK